VSDPDGSGETFRVFGSENILDQSVALFYVKPAVIGDDARGILSAVLYSEKSLIKISESLVVSEYSYHTTHDYPSGPVCMKRFWIRLCPQSPSVRFFTLDMKTAAASPPPASGPRAGPAFRLYSKIHLKSTRRDRL
jgi:hypothetical protein